MTARFPARRFLTGLAASVVLIGCGPTPPQAPLQQAKKLDASTSDIATECGLTYQVTAFRGDHRKELANLEAEASASVHSLASVYVRNPNWIYQGETVRQIVADATEMLRECGLHRAERTLRRATSM